MSLSKEDEELIERLNNGGYLTAEDLGEEESNVSKKDEELIERLNNGGYLTAEDLED